MKQSKKNYIAKAIKIAEWMLSKEYVQFVDYNDIKDLSEFLEDIDNKSANQCGHSMSLESCSCNNNKTFRCFCGEQC